MTILYQIDILKRDLSDNSSIVSNYLILTSDVRDILISDDAEKAIKGSNRVFLVKQNIEDNLSKSLKSKLVTDFGMKILSYKNQNELQKKLQNDNGNFLVVSPKDLKGIISDWKKNNCNISIQEIDNDHRENINLELEPYLITIDHAIRDDGIGDDGIGDELDEISLDSKKNKQYKDGIGDELDEISLDSKKNEQYKKEKINNNNNNNDIENDDFSDIDNNNDIEFDNDDSDHDDIDNNNDIENDSDHDDVNNNNHSSAHNPHNFFQGEHHPRGANVHQETSAFKIFMGIK